MPAVAPKYELNGEFKHFNAVPCTQTIGATIEGLHLSELNDESAEELRQALWQYGVLFFREQHLSPADQIRVASLKWTPIVEQLGSRNKVWSVTYWLMLPYFPMSGCCR